MDGIGATQAISAGDPSILNVPIVALTADALSGHRERYISAGMDDHLAKPIDPKAFFAVLERYGRPPSAAASK
ncbi:MAG: response regulator [Acetobacteraceae bacterium]|nr:response regulator [Acetobacteraceae bacterium]